MRSGKYEYRVSLKIPCLTSIILAITQSIFSESSGPHLFKAPKRLPLNQPKTAEKNMGFLKTPCSYPFLH